MRYSLFSNEVNAETFRQKVQAKCDADWTPGTPRIVILPFTIYDGRTAISMPYEPATLQGTVVDASGLQIQEEQMGED